MPILYFAANEHCDGSNIMITGSHNPPDYHGFKWIPDGTTPAGDNTQVLRKIIESGEVTAKAEYAGNVVT